MREIKYYIETSVLNFVFADDEQARRDITRKLFKEFENKGTNIYISSIVITEIDNAPEEIKNRLMDLIRKYKPTVLPVDDETKDLADKYVSEGVIPSKYIADALHIAVASINNMDAIISWNFRHIVKLKTKVEVNGVNKLLGYKEVEICSPEEVIEL